MRYISDYIIEKNVNFCQKYLILVGVKLYKFILIPFILH